VELLDGALKGLLDGSILGGLVLGRLVALGEEGLELGNLVLHRVKLAKHLGDFVLGGQADTNVLVEDGGHKTQVEARVSADQVLDRGKLAHLELVGEVLQEYFFF